MSGTGIGWFPIKISEDGKTVQFDGRTHNLGAQTSYPPMAIIARRGNLFVIKEPGRSHMNLMHKQYHPAKFEVWQISDDGLRADRVLDFPVRS